MASKSCMNVKCGGGPSSNSIGWRKGWTLRSGEFANLCDNCGSAYEQSIFCEVFHSKESGWRECTSCGKRLHCGCIAARVLLELLDSGGVNCISCARSLGPHNIMSDEKPNGIGMTTVDNGELKTTAVHQTDGSSINKLELIQCISDGIGFKHLLHSQNDQANESVGRMKQEEVTPSSRETGSKSNSDSNKPSIGSSQTTKLEEFRKTLGGKYIYESLAHTNLSITLGAPSGNLNPFPSAAVDEREHSKTSTSVHQGPRSRQLLPKPPKSALAVGLETSAEMIQHLRVARPPAEGRGRNQLLPRYWPRITDQELQQISGDSNCIIVPLFEKILSASDAGRIGRLVLPKACAEAYFPPISQPEGLPLRIQDVKGKEWVFQFRFWPNNNSRMYVLEGVTPCIQSMQLQAGDTVTFSRMDPEGKLVMGFRKASTSVSMQDAQSFAVHNGKHSSQTFFSDDTENLPIINGCSGLLQSLKESTDLHVNALSKHLLSTCEDSHWHNTEKHGGTTIESLMLQSMLVPERKSTRNIGTKSKRLLIDSQDALELKLTWEEVQDMLRPPPSVRASVVTIEDHEFEEYEEPPVFGKRSIFVIRTSGRQEQWAQCDNCLKWRRLPVDVLLPSRWTCTENSWDPNRCSCSAQDELSPRELENLLSQNKDFKKRKMATNHGPILGHESSGLDALANAAVLGDKSSTSVATTTKHPRHRPGCSCIVCIQPPSGKGKHKPTCTCNVCMTVKRRFKTLMMRKKKRQSEREAEIAQQNHLMCNPKDEAEVYNSSAHVMLQLDPSDNDSRLVKIALESKNESNYSSNKLTETSKKGHIDLNSHPGRGEDAQEGLARVSMMSLLQIASLPLETYLNQNGLTSLISEQQQTSSGSHMLAQATRESEGRLNEDRCLASEPAVHEQDCGNDEHH